MSPAEKTLTNKAEKCKDKIIDLQDQRSDVAKEIVALDKLIKEHTDDSKQLVEDKKQCDELIHKSDNFKLEIKKALDELSAQIVFQCSYKKVVEDDFKTAVPKDKI